MNDERRKREILLEKLRETVATYGDGLSVADASAMLSRVKDEIGKVAYQKMDAAAAARDYTVDFHGIVRDREEQGEPEERK